MRITKHVRTKMNKHKFMTKDSALYTNTCMLKWSHHN